MYMEYVPSSVMECIESQNVLHLVLIATKTNFNLPDRKGRLPLHVAISTGNAEIVETILLQGTDIESKNPNGENAWFLAVRCGNVEIADMIAKKGADIDQKNADGATALMIAIERGNLLLVEYLLEEGADLQVSDNMGRRPVDLAVGARQDIRKLLLEYVSSSFEFEEDEKREIMEKLV